MEIGVFPSRFLWACRAWKSLMGEYTKIERAARCVQPDQAGRTG